MFTQNRVLDSHIYVATSLCGFPKKKTKERILLLDRDLKEGLLQLPNRNQRQPIGVFTIRKSDAFLSDYLATS